MKLKELKSLAVSTLAGHTGTNEVFEDLHQSRATCWIDGGVEGDRQGRLLFKADFQKLEIEIRFQWNYWRNADDWDYLGKMGMSVYDQMWMEKGAEQLLKPLFRIPDPPEPKPVGWEDDPFDLGRATTCQ